VLQVWRASQVSQNLISAHRDAMPQRVPHGRDRRSRQLVQAIDAFERTKRVHCEQKPPIAFWYPKCFLRLCTTLLGESFYRKLVPWSVLVMWPRNYILNA